MALRCQLCGEELKYDCKVCHNCEKIVVDNGLRNDKKWRCDNFLELPSLPFGSNLKSDVLEKFSKVFETEFPIRNWNCDTSIACTELLSTELPTVNSGLIGHHVEILENPENIINKFVGIQDEKKNLLIYE